MLLVLAGAFSVTAQNVAETVELGEALTLTLPEGWAVADPDSEVVYVLEGVEPVVLTHPEGLTALIAPPAELLAAVPDLAEATELLEGLSLSMDALLSLSVDERLITERLAGKRDALTLADLDDQILPDRAIFRDITFFRVMDDLPVFVVTYAEVADVRAPLLEAEQALFDALADMTEPTTPESEPAAGASCTVSTESARTVPLRVGPGFNRGTFAFLPAGQSFDAIGRFVAPDGSVWLRLDKAQVAPDAGAEQLWVAQADVEIAGNCGQIADAAAPPIRAAQPTAVPSTGGGDGGGGGAVVAPASRPAAGSWTLTLAERGLVSCLNTNTIEFQSSELGVTSFSATLTLTGDGFRWDGSDFTPQPNGSYATVWSLGNDSAGIKLFVQNSNFMSGEMVVNTTFNTVGCSATIGVTMSRN